MESNKECYGLADTCVICGRRVDIYAPTERKHGSGVATGRCTVVEMLINSFKERVNDNKQNAFRK
jgi:hypothetical protein